MKISFVVALLKPKTWLGLAALRSALGLMFIACLTQAVQASEQALRQEIDNYIEIFQGNNFAEQRKAIEAVGLVLESPARFSTMSLLTNC